MKISKKLETEIKTLMDDYWSSYFKGDLEHWANYLVDDYRNIGGTEEEIWNSKKEILDYTHRIIGQMEGVTDLRNKQVQVIPYDPYIMVHEFLDIYIKVDEEWSFYQKFRLSSLIQNTSDGWKVLHQHGSYPDAHTEQGEAFAFDKLRKENTQLREAVMKRTLELEHKNRELQIEAAVERVRAEALAMNQRSDLEKVTQALYRQLIELQVPGMTGVSIYLVDENDLVSVWDLSSPGNISNPDSYSFKYDSKKYPVLGGWVEEWKTSNQDYFLLEFPIESLIQAVEELKEIHPDMGGYLKDAIDTGKLEHQWNPVGRFDGGILSIDLMMPPGDEVKTLISKMAAAFNLAYQRFNEIERAEAQAREAQVEAALERVRSRTMAMQKSEELREVIQVVYDQFIHLHIHVEHTGFILDYKERDDMHIWLADKHAVPFQVTIPYFNCAHWNSFKEAKENGKDFFANHLSFDEKNKFYQDLFRLIPVPEETLSYYLNCPGLAISTVLLENVGLYIENFSGIPYTNEENATLMRLGNVFQQTYTRFLDLQNAEAQAREAKIEAALERIRATTMAMHKSEELLETSRVLFEQFKQLGQHADQLTIGIVNEAEGIVEICATVHGHQLPKIFRHSISEPYVMNKIYRGWKTEKKSLILELSAKELEAYNQIRNEMVGTEMFTTHVPPDQKRVIYASYFSKGMLAFGDSEQPTGETKDILNRFAKVFEQTYTRFLDLQKAEAQAREAKIEAALERVRSRTMAMQRSDELLEVATVLFQQVKGLGVPQWNCGFNIWNIGDDEFTYYPGSPDGIISPTPCRIPLHEHRVFKRFDESRKRGDELLVFEKAGEEQADHYRYMLSLPGVGDLLQSMLDRGFELPAFQIDHLANFAYGNMIFITYEHFPQMHDVFKRFAKVFEQTYTRFLDLQKAEAQAREAQIELSLERIRAQVTSMQTSSDLLDIVVMMRKEFVALGHEAHYFWHMRWHPDFYEKAMTSGDGTRIGMVMTLPRHVHAGIKILDEWEKSHEPIVVYAMDVHAAVDYIDKMISLGDFEMVDPNAPTLDDIRHIGGLTFVMARTTHGEIGFSLPGTVPDPPKEALITLIRFAGVFDLAYKRFLDLQMKEDQAARLKEEKERLELTLSELKATQTQLVQSEKMASLGELTAGIAHEIQNPLNFINNFSEVNLELIAEMEQEITKGNPVDALDIAEDIKQNLQKVSHHGKRAGAIVKSMLQHSRKTGGEKEPVDLNTLVDEFLRLSYHGLRAKDKSFNCILETHFDATVGKVDVVGQDIGRVLLNLFNNAFYAVNEKKLASTGKAGQPYEPTVSVSTKKENSHVVIKVTDNGTGIPEKVLEKIYQPFFTTKPTGEGTGLGLSLSYDIITKGHGGEMKVETKEGEGSEFIIEIQAYNPVAP